MTCGSSSEGGSRPACGSSSEGGSRPACGSSSEGGSHPASVVKLAGRLARHRGRLFTAGALLFIAWWMTPVLVGLGLRGVFDAIAGEARLGIGWTIAIYLAVEALRVTLFSGALRVWARWWAHTAGVMRANLLEAQLSPAPPHRRVHDAGAAVTVFRDDVEDFIIWVDTWLDAAGTFLYACVALAIMARVDATITLVVALPFLAAFMVTRVLTHRLRRTRVADREATEAVTGLLGELFSSVLAIKVAGAEEAVIARLRALNATRLRTALADRLLTDGLYAANSSFVQVSTGLVLLLAAGSMREGNFTVGDLALFTTYVAWLSALPRWAGLLLARHRHAQVANQRLSSLSPEGAPDAYAANRPLALERYASPPPAIRVPEPAPAAIRIRGLNARHPDGSIALRDIDLAFPPGSLTVITGPVGAGKTSLLRALLGLLEDINGELWWNDEPVTARTSWFVPPRSAYVSQVPRLYSDTLEDNLRLGTAVGDHELTEAVRLAILEEDLAVMPHGLGTVIGSRGVRLSGGQIQRVAAARALAARPALLMVDDLSSALDVTTEASLWKGLLAHRRATMIAVSHRPATLAAADQVVELRGGAVWTPR